MTDSVYDRMLAAGLDSLDTVTGTIHVLGPGYTFSAAHVDTSDIDVGDIIATETAVLSVETTGGASYVRIPDDEVGPIDLLGAEEVGGFVWSAGTDLISFHDPDPGPPDDPLTVTFADGIIKADQG